MSSDSKGPRFVRPLEESEDFHRWALDAFVDAYSTFPEDAEEIVAFVERQERLGTIEKQILYDVIRELYAWSKEQTSEGGSLPVLPAHSFLMPGGFTCRFCGTPVALNGAELAARVMTFIEVPGLQKTALPAPCR